ncbi:conserved hypothetical protein [Histoplasma capsulatum var. duboisii H88]|uniref:Uncharacterized protein n=2 Tax=Ajellomyces capsulatus TaxID=5037 RepID=F0UTP1_AJEC8|nr:conserved hypothetical protein [Histoplasma capsulatum H143]EGC49268.1 conserved hypothetical protein [Histoplasma capsulatum var. duboisii H88]
MSDVPRIQLGRKMKMSYSKWHRTCANQPSRNFLAGGGLIEESPSPAGPGVDMFQQRSSTPKTLGKAIRNPQSLAYLTCVQAGPETLPGSIQGARGRRNNNTQEARMAWGEK